MMVEKWFHDITRITAPPPSTLAVTPLRSHDRFAPEPDFSSTATTVRVADYGQFTVNSRLHDKIQPADSAELRLELKRIQLELGSTILYVTHDQVEAMTMASRIGVIRDGELLQVGTPREIYETPADRYVAGRLGTPPINFLPADLLPHAAMPPRTETLGIRTEHLQIARANGGQFTGRVHRIEHLGDQNHVHLEYRDRMLVTLADPHRPLDAGQEVELQLVGPLYFDATGRRIAPAVH